MYEEALRKNVLCTHLLYNFGRSTECVRTKMMYNMCLYRKLLYGFIVQFVVHSLYISSAFSFVEGQEGLYDDRRRSWATQTLGATAAMDMAKIGFC